jgi:quinoprotein glucose dehydrogenase
MGRVLIPGQEADDGSDDSRSGSTVVEWHYGGTAGFSGPEGLPIFKPPYGRITAIDMNTGETLWWIPNGDTPSRIAEHPLLRGVDLPNTGQPSHATALVTRTLLMYGEGREGEPRFHAVDKRTGERIATVDVPAPTQTAPMTYLHDGRQYVVMAIGGDGVSASLVALRLP